MQSITFFLFRQQSDQISDVSVASRKVNYDRLYFSDLQDKLTNSSEISIAPRRVTFSQLCLFHFLDKATQLVMFLSRQGKLRVIDFFISGTRQPT